MLKRRVSLSIAACLLGAMAIACGTEPSELTGSRAVAVQPRVIVDGMVELGAITTSIADATLIIDEVLFHAPAVRVQEGDTTVDSLLSAQDPLLFRYEAASSDGFGDVIGAERRWTIDETNIDGDLVVGFSPLAMTLPDTGVDLTSLQGHTATVHGYMLMSSPDAAGLGHECDGDPDGNPAACTDSSASKDTEGDPDGNPSEGDPDGNPSEGDPDGNPAKSGKGDDSEGDPDGNPADGDPDGNPSEGPEVDGKREGELVLNSRDEVRAQDARVLRKRVPFLIVLNRAFSLRVPVAGLFEESLAADEVRPLELRVPLDELLSEEIVAFLAQKATDDERGQIVVEIPDAQVGLEVDNEGVERRVRADVTGGGIRVLERH